MALRLIGAGLPRTGTSSLREALERLLGGPVYHMREAFAHPEHVPTWVAAISGETPDWSDFLGGYTAGVDTPFSSCWRALAAAHPDAPVLLSTRDSAEQWYRSMDATVLARTREVWAADDRSDPMTPLFEVMFDGVFTDPHDPDDVMAGYQRRIDEVRDEIAPERLIEWRAGDGWEPICRALDLPVPPDRFPHENTTADFLARTDAKRAGSKSTGSQQVGEADR